MGLIYSATTGFVIWIVLWAIGVKAVDSFMITVLVVVLAVGARMLVPYLPGHQRS